MSNSQNTSGYRRKLECKQRNRKLRTLYREAALVNPDAIRMALIVRDIGICPDPARKIPTFQISSRVSVGYSNVQEDMDVEIITNQ